MPNHIDAQIESPQRPPPEQHEIGLLGEHNVIGGRNAACVDDCKTQVTLDVSAVRHDESLTSLRADSERFQDGARNPGKLTFRVDKSIGELPNLAVLRYALDPNSRSKDSQFCHFTSQRPESLYHCSAVGIFAMPR